jgi:chromosome partitioning protein
VGQTVACANQKGGVGKTTTVVNLGTYLALRGEHVLIVDVDSQGNATSGLGIDRSRIDRSIYDALVEETPLTGIRIHTAVDGLDLVPSSVSLAGAEVELAGAPDREHRLARVIEAIAPEYDHILLDCPPSLGLLTVNALTAADAVLIPIQCEYYALEGLSQLLSNIELIEKHLNPDLRLSTILLTMYDSRTNLAQQVAQEVRDHFPLQTLETIIPRSVRVSEAPSYGQSVISYDFSSSGSLSYREAAAEIALRGAADQEDTH